MKNLLLTSSLVLITSIANAQNRGGGNVALFAQSNVNYNTNLSNVYSNVSSFNSNQSNVSNRGMSNPINVNVADNNVNIQQRTNKVVRTRPVNVPTRNVQRNGVNEVVLPGNNRNINVSNVADNNSEQNTPAINFIQSVANEDAVIDNVIPEVQKVEVAQVQAVAQVKEEINFTPELNVNINLPKPNITFDLKVKEEKNVKEKATPIKVSSGSGVTKVKSKTKSRNSNKHKSKHHYSQKVSFGTVLRNSISKLKHKLKKTKTKKTVFTVVCYKF